MELVETIRQKMGSILFENLRQSAFKLNEQNTEAFIEDNRKQVGGLVSADDLAGTIEAVIDRFRDIQGRIETARLGSQAALAELTAAGSGFKIPLRAAA